MEAAVLCFRIDVILVLTAGSNAIKPYAANVDNNVSS